MADLKKKSVNSSAEFDYKKYAARISKWIDTNPAWLRDTLTLIFATSIAKNASLTLIENKYFRDVNGFIIDICSSLTGGIDANSFCRVFKDSHSLNCFDSTASIIIPKPGAYTSIEDILKQPCPSFDEESFPVKKIERLPLVAKYVAKNITISPEAKKNILEIVMELQAQFDYARFPYTRTNNMIGILKAITYLSGDDVVKDEHLFFMSAMWTYPSDADQFMAIVEPMTKNYDALASALRARLVAANNRMSNARMAVSNHVDLNYYDTTITAQSMDDLITSQVQEMTHLKSEVDGALEGKVENKATAEMFKLRKMIEESHNTLLRARGIKP